MYIIIDEISEEEIAMPSSKELTKSDYTKFADECKRSLKEISHHRSFWCKTVRRQMITSMAVLESKARNVSEEALLVDILAGGVNLDKLKNRHKVVMNKCSKASYKTHNYGRFKISQKTSENKYKNDEHAHIRAKNCRTI